RRGCPAIERNSLFMQTSEKVFALSVGVRRKTNTRREWNRNRSTALEERTKEDFDEHHSETEHLFVRVCRCPDHLALDRRGGPGRRVDLRNLEPRQEPQRRGRLPWP